MNLVLDNVKTHCFLGEFNILFHQIYNILDCYMVESVVIEVLFILTLCLRDSAYVTFETKRGTCFQIRNNKIYDIN